MIKVLRQFVTATAVFSLLIALTSASYGQSFQVAETDVSIEGTPDYFVEPHTDVSNLTSSTLPVHITVVENTLPQDWQITICLSNCFAPGVFDVTDYLDPNDTKPLKLTITTNSEAATGYIKIKLSNGDIPAENMTVTFNVSVTPLSAANPSTPRQLALSQNYPNPVSLGGNAVTTIAYSIPRTTQVSLKVYNLLGKEIRTLVNEQRPQGMHSTLWDGRDKAGNMVPPGVYVYKLSNGKSTQTRRMLLTR